LNALVGARVVLPILYFMLCTIYTCEYFTDLHHNIAEGIVIFLHVVSIVVDSFLPRLNRSTYSCPVGVTLCFLQPPVHSILQSVMVVCIMMSSWTLSFSRPNRCNVRTVQVWLAMTLSNQTS